VVSVSSVTERKQKKGISLKGPEVVAVVGCVFGVLVWGPGCQRTRGQDSVLCSVYIKWI
jgi:hypothetical protein